MKRIKQLDSLRAIAVILVILHHSPLGEHSRLLNRLPLGANMFMVLSGYLVTAILLHEKEKAALLEISNWTLYKNFIAKRALRIFPLYFLVVGLLTLLQGGKKPFLLLSLATFTSNFYQYYKQEWNEYAHTWSLSVQEHFYLIWPLLLLFVSKKWVLPVIIAFTAIGIISQKFIFPTVLGSILTPSCFDALGMGALLAWLFSNQHEQFQRTYRWISVAALVSFIVVAYCHHYNLPMILPFRSWYAVIVVWLIASFLHKGEQSLWNTGYLINNAALRFIGKISFGLYLLHLVIPVFFAKPLMWINNLLPAASKAYAQPIWWMEQYLLLVFVAWLSYRFLEMPFIQLKKHFATSKVVKPVLQPVPKPLEYIMMITMPGTLEKKTS
jgi:peptidoglycan/LPS O-acetylase OafA/YrhL